MGSDFHVLFWDFWKKLKRKKIGKFGQKRAPTPQRREPTQWCSRPKPRCGIPSPRQSRGAKMAPLGYATA